ncbi:stalk domain-containing protein [Geosporobacter ferrireducens]|uniref:stalk domain-containing protein n=1 Tax=Geosporobacter ferrireducens TaxID=1424294 RepID=UPI00139DF87B|nr:stalk domain-containing protein [Geosporobacter ferrireducens]MTI53307.1 hypothetical protein [Geosporobacter ferrireducens]
MRRIGKITTFVVLSCAIFTTSITNAQSNIGSTPRILVNNIEQTYDTLPIIENGRTLIPMRGVFESLGAEVQWDEATKTVKGKKENTEIELKIGSYFAYKNDEKIQLDVQPKIVDGRTMIPLRFVGEALGADVQWDQNSKTVDIKTQKEENSVKQEEDSSKKKVETNQRHISYEEAVALALKNSYDLELKKKALKRAEEQNDNLDVTIGRYNPSQIQAKKSLQVSEKWAEKQIDITEESIAVQVKNAMDAINLQKKELAVSEKTVENYTNKLKKTETLYKTGMESKYNLEMAEKNLSQEKKQKEILEKNIENAYVTLNQTLGLPSDERYTLEEDFNYEQLESMDIEQYAKAKVPSMPSIWYQEQQIELLELGLKLYEYNSGSDSYVVKQMDISSAKTSLASTKQSFEEAIRAYYNQIKQIEENYKLQEMNLEKVKSSLKLLETQFDAGLVTAIELEDLYLSLEQIKLAMNKLVVQHSQLKVLLEKPYL